MPRPPLRQWSKVNAHGDETTTMFNKKTRAPEDTYVGTPYYRTFLLDREVARLELDDPSWEMITIKMPQLDIYDKDPMKKWLRQVKEIWEWLAKFQPTLAWVNDDGKFVAISIRSKGIGMGWASFKSLATRMGGNIMKRFGALTTKAHMFHDFENTELVEEPMYGPHPVYEFDPEHLITMTVPDPDVPVDIDGELYMDMKMFMFLLDEMDARIRPHDEAKADHLRKKFLSTRVFTFRGLGEKDEFKGHVIVCDQLEAPLMAHGSNLKKELYNGIVGSFAMHMMPEVQGKGVRSNRSTVGLFMPSLFAVPTPGMQNSEGLLFDAFRKYVDQIRDNFLMGRPLPFVDAMNRNEKDSMTTVYSKIEDWYGAGKSLNESLYLQMLQAGAVRQMWGEIDPKKEPKVRTSLPAPYARQWHIKNWDTFRRAFVTSAVEEPAYGEYFTHPMLGMVVSNPTFRDAIDVLGKGDKDDKVEEHVRRLVEALLFLGMQFNEDEIVAFVLRNPVGITCDVNGNTGVEYFMLRPTQEQAKALIREYGELPELDPTLLPLNLKELGDLHLDFPSPAPVTEPTYSFDYFQKQAEKAGLTQGVYGSHVNIRLNHYIYNLTFEAGGYEEDFIDTHAKTRDPDGLDYMVAKNATETATIEQYFIGLDDHEVKEVINNNPINVCIDFHRELTEQLLADMREHVVYLQEILEIAWKDIKPAHMEEGDVPAPIFWMRKSEEYYLKEKSRRTGRRETTLRGNKDYEAVGNLVAEQLMKYVGDPSNTKFTRKSVFRDLREAHRWILGNMVLPSKYNDAYTESMFRNTDSLLIRGQLFSMLVAAMEEELDREELALMSKDGLFSL